MRLNYDTRLIQTSSLSVKLEVSRMWLFTTESPTIILPHYLGLKFTLGVVETSQYINLNTALMVENIEERPDELCQIYVARKN